MKHAFLIIAHNEYPVLEVLLSMLDDERNDIYLHIDKRATELFQQIKKVKMQKAGFYLIENPIKVYWGDISQVQVEYLLFETGLSRFLAGIIFYTREVLLTSHYEKRLFEHASQPRVACADIRLLSYLWSRTNLSRDSYQSG